MNIDEDALRRLIARRATLEHNTFLFPPSDWGEFCLMRGRWQEVNDQIKEIEAEISAEADYEASR